MTGRWMPQIFFGSLVLITMVIPAGVGVYDFCLYLVDPSGKTTISYMMVTIGYENPLVAFLMGNWAMANFGVWICLGVHFWGGMVSLPVRQRIAQLTGQVESQKGYIAELESRIKVLQGRA